MKNNIIPGDDDYLLRKIHGNNLIYNCCWEDPRIDRKLLEINDKSRILMITSGGCNALDYLLDKPAEIHCVDVNPRQNALLDLKLALIKRGSHDDFHKMFSRGSHPDYKTVMSDALQYLPEYAAGFWRPRMKWFSGHSLRRSFYHHGTTGTAAWIVKLLLKYTQPDFLHEALAVMNASTLEQQSELYKRIETRRIHRWIIRAFSSRLFLALMGVSRQQIRMLMNGSTGETKSVVREVLSKIHTLVPMHDNYFYRVYATGSYATGCEPEYLLRENFAVLCELSKIIKIYQLSVAQFLRRFPGAYTHFVLLDHQDWLTVHDPRALRDEWRLIIENCAPGARVLLRTAGLNLDFLPDFVAQHFDFNPGLTRTLHLTDRPGTYGSVHLGILKHRAC